MLRPSRYRRGKPIDVTVVIELTFKIQDLPHNESYELLGHNVNPMDIVNFISDLHHLSFWGKTPFINSSR